MFVVPQGLEPCQTEPKPVVLPLHHETGVKNITYLHRQMMYGKNTNLFFMKKGHTAVCFVSQAGLEPTRFAEQGILFLISDPTDKSTDFPHFPY